MAGGDNATLFLTYTIFSSWGRCIAIAIFFVGVLGPGGSDITFRALANDAAYISNSTYHTGVSAGNH